MRPLIQGLVKEIDGVRLFAANLFDHSGQHADQLIRPVADGFEILDAILDLTIAHKIDTCDVYTDSEDVFAQFLGMPGFNVRLISERDLAPLYHVLKPGNPTYSVIKDLYLTPKEIEEECLHLNDTSNSNSKTNVFKRLGAAMTRSLSKLAGVLRILRRNSKPS